MEKYHVLVVEDDNEIANAIKIYLQNQGYDVYVGNDGLEGLEIVEKETIHLAIVDIMMPRMDGLTMVAKLREKYDFPVIFLSAKSEDIDKITGLNIGADDYITKPFGQTICTDGIDGTCSFPSKTLWTLFRCDSTQRK